MAEVCCRRPLLHRLGRLRPGLSRTHSVQPTAESTPVSGTSMRPMQPRSHWYEEFPPGKSDGNVKLTTHLHLVPRCGMGDGLFCCVICLPMEEYLCSYLLLLLRHIFRLSASNFQYFLILFLACCTL